jgi:predicted metal-binding membrane protein
MGASLLERGLRHERAVVAAGLLLAVLLSWAYLFNGAGTLQDMDGMLMPMHSGPWTPAYALLMLLMWCVMMAAMMLPSAAPMILLYARIAAGRQGRATAALSGMFALGYLAVWSAFSVAAVALQYGLERAALLSPMLETSSVALAGALLLAAGIYQWLPLKQACLRHCRSPLDFVLSHWRGGAGGALRMGVQHGALCLGCCWALMLLLFVGGVMNLAWIGALALLVLVEKLAPAGHWMGRAAGVVLAAWGGATLLHAWGAA